MSISTDQDTQGLNLSLKPEAAMKLKEAWAQQTSYSTSTLSCAADKEPSIWTSDLVVSFVDPEVEPEVGAMDMEKTGSEVSTSDALPADGESSTTAPSLFGDDVPIDTFGAGTRADFFSTMGQDQCQRHTDNDCPSYELWN